jgi:hypothetical protein
MRSGRLQGFIPQKLAHFEEHILTLHTACTEENFLPPSFYRDIKYNYQLPVPLLAGMANALPGMATTM